jgi:gluconolactonase
MCKSYYKTDFMKILFTIILLPLLLIGSPIIQEKGKSTIIAKGAKLEKVADGFLFTEGPSADASGNICFTDQPNDRIMRWSLTEGLTTLLEPSGRSNGLSFDTEGNLWACADEKNELWKISPDKQITVFPLKYDNKKLNGPNDLWIAADGGIYFTDPFYKRQWWSHSVMPQNCQGVYYLSPDQKTLTRVIDDLTQPNGIVGAPDGKTLYVADIRGKKTWSYTIHKDGSLSGKSLFCEMGSDGITIDMKGNLYLTGDGVSIFNKEGKLIEKISVPERWTANVCFGGSDMKSLYITASKGLYRIKLKVKGTRG